MEADGSNFISFLSNVTRITGKLDGSVEPFDNAGLERLSQAL